MRSRWRHHPVPANPSLRCFLDRFLLIAYDASITVYSTSTSLQVRHLRTKKKESISAFALSAITLSQLYLSTITGAIEQWDWIEGLKLASWKLSSSIYCLATSKHSKDAGGRNEAVNGESANPGVFRAEAAQDKAASNEITRIDASKNDTARDLVYTIDRKGQGQWMLSAHRLEWGDDAAKTDVVTLLKYSEPLSAFKVLEGGRVIVAISGKELIVGKSNSAESSKVRDISYVWRIVECPEWVASIDVRIRPTGRSQTQAEKGGYLSEAVDVAVGGLKGSIHIYEDMLRKLVHKERVAKTGNDVDVTSRRLHWHRNVVLAIKWSLDGKHV